MTRKEVASFAAQIYCYCNVGITFKNIIFSKGFMLANFELSRLSQTSVLIFCSIFCTIMLNPGCFDLVSQKMNSNGPYLSVAWTEHFPFWHHRHALRITEGKLIENIEGHMHCNFASVGSLHCLFPIIPALPSKLTSAGSSCPFVSRVHSRVY